MKKLAIIGGGRMASIFAKNAKEMNIETYCFSPSSGVIDQAIFDNYFDIDIFDYSKILEICKKVQISGVVATTELTIAPVAYIASKLNLNGISYEVAKKITNKYRNRNATSMVGGLNHPKYAEIYKKEDIDKLNFNFPIILKPTSKGGKRGVTVIKNSTQIDEAYNYALKESNNALPFIVEEFIEGEMECSVESLSYKGKNYIIQITEKITSGPPHCVELAHHQPARMDENLKNKIEKIMDDALTCVGVNNGPCHTEIKIKDREIYLIEFNARPGGDHIAYPLTELSTGYEYIKGAINIAIDNFVPIDKKQFLNRCAGVLFVTEQTKNLEKLFDNCEEKEWCYKKNKVSNELQTLIHNDGYNINYFIYSSNKIPKEIGNEC